MKRNRDNLCSRYKKPAQQCMTLFKSYKIDLVYEIDVGERNKDVSRYINTIAANTDSINTSNKY